MAELYRKGLGPVAGGVLDQSESFVTACQTVWAEQARWRTEATDGETPD